MRNLKEETYGSAKHFVSVNGLEKEAESLFGKGWECGFDIEQVERLITLIGADFYEVKDDESSDYDFDVELNEDKKRISELEGQIEMLQKRLGETKENFARTCDVTGEGMNEGFLYLDTMYFKYEKDLIAQLKKDNKDNEGMSDDFILNDSYNAETHYYTEWELNQN